MNLKEFDWAGYGILAIVIILLAGMAFTIITLGGCAALGLSQGSTGVTTVIPSSPAAQMWKVVAKSNWVVTVCLLGFGAGLFTFFNGKPKLGLAIVFSCAGTLFFGLAVHRFPTWMAVVGLFGSIVGAAASVIQRKDAIIEIIKGGQIFKEKTPDLKQTFNVDQRIAQSPTTQKLVKKVKSDLKLKGQIK